MSHEEELLCDRCGSPYGSSWDRCPHCEEEANQPRPSFTQKKMCSQCPFRNNAAPGWLGDYTAEEIIQVIRSEQHFYCHSKIDYNKSNWREHLNGKPHCAGALQMTKSMCKMPRDREHSAAVKAIKLEDNCFKLPDAFIKHHAKKWSKSAR